MSDSTNSNNRVSSFGLIGVILLTVLLGVIVMMIFEKYFGMVENKTLVRFIILGLILNIGITIFLIFSFSRVTFAIGPEGPRGIRGRVGMVGNYASVNKCNKINKNLAREKYDIARAKTVVIQKPSLEESFINYITG